MNSQPQSSVSDYVRENVELNAAFLLKHTSEAGLGRGSEMGPKFMVLNQELLLKQTGDKRKWDKVQRPRLQ